MIPNNSTTIQDVLLYDKNKTNVVSIKPCVLSVDIKESIFSFNMIGSLSILDADGIYEKYDLGNKEYYVQINIASSKDNKLYGLVFYVDSINGYKTSNDNTVSFTMNLITFEAYVNVLTRINKGYSGPKNAIIGDIMSGLSNRQFIYNNFNDENRILFPYMHPFDCIDLLLLYGSDIPDCLFWENMRGFNLNRVTQLLTNNPVHRLKDTDDSVVSDNDLLKNSDVLYDTSRISKYNVNSINNSRLQYLNKGISGNVVQTYNPVTGTPEKYKYNETDSNCKTYMYSCDNLNYRSYSQRHDILNKLHNNSIDIEVPGDISRATGDSIFVEITNNSTDRQYNNKLSGVFIITEIVHTFYKIGYVQHIKISK